MINPTLPTDERVRLMMSIFSDRDEVEVFRYLSGSDAQAFVDVIDKVSVRILSPLENVLVKSTKTSVPCRLAIGWIG